MCEKCGGHRRAAPLGVFRDPDDSRVHLASIITPDDDRWDFSLILHIAAGNAIGVDDGTGELLFAVEQFEVEWAAEGWDLPFADYTEDWEANGGHNNNY